MSQIRIKVKHSPISSLLRDVDAGKFAIPRLQREFVWNGPKAAKFLDSILRGMPVGVVLIWDTPKSQRLHLRQRFHVLPAFDQRNRSVWFLIDGQQRVSVLHHVREGDKVRNARRQEVDFARVVVALDQADDDQLVRYRRPQEGAFVSLSNVLHPQWRQRNRHLKAREIRRLAEVRNSVLRYRLFQMFISGGVDEVRETFLRINTQGMKITTADAVFTQAENLELRDVVHGLREQLDERFSSIGDEPLLFLVAAIRGATEARGQAVDAAIRRLNRQASKDERLRKSLARDWNRLGPCLARAANYLREQFAVVSRDFLASDYMLSVLAYFFFKNKRGPNPAQAQEINKWFWATSVGSRYSGRDFNRCVPQDLKYFDGLASGKRPRFKYRPQVEDADVRRAQYGSRTAITSAVYCMLLKRRPVYLFDRGVNDIPYDVYAGRSNRKDRHHIFPRNVLSRAGIGARQYNSIANICLLVAQENQQVGSQRPSNYLGDMKDAKGAHFRAKMSRHLIPIEPSSGVWDGRVERGFRRFLGERTTLLCRELEREAGIRLFRRDRSG